MASSASYSLAQSPFLVVPHTLRKLTTAHPDLPAGLSLLGHSIFRLLPSSSVSFLVVPHTLHKLTTAHLDVCADLSLLGHSTFHLLPSSSVSFFSSSLHTTQADHIHFCPAFFTRTWHPRHPPARCLPSSSVFFLVVPHTPPSRFSCRSLSARMCRLSLPDAYPLRFSSSSHTTQADHSASRFPCRSLSARTCRLPLRHAYPYGSVSLCSSSSHTTIPISVQVSLCSDVASSASLCEMLALKPSVLHLVCHGDYDEVRQSHHHS